MRHYRTTSTSTIARAAAIGRGNWVARGGLLLLVMASLTLIWLSKNDSRMVAHLRTTITDGLVPLVEALSAPAEFAGEVNARVDAYLSVYSENERLKKENLRLVQWQSIARQLEAENEALRQLADLKGEPALHFVSARVVGAGGHLYNQSIMLDSGKDDGVDRFQAVVTHEGLVGRIKETGKSSAQVIAVTDINSRIPIIGETSRDKAILAGNNSTQPVLRYLPDETGLHVGERIITTSDGGVFPAGLVVGEVASIDGNVIRIQPYVDFDRLEYVRVVSASVQ